MEIIFGGSAASSKVGCRFKGYGFQKLAPNGTIIQPTPFECLMLELPYILKSFNFGFIASAFVILIIIISIFGRIKLHYRWFILNMALIDLITCYDVICNSAAKECQWFYDFPNYINISRVISKLPYIGIFILTGSRFLSLYFSKAYKKLARVWKIFIIIAFIDIIYMLINIIPLHLIDIIVDQKCDAENELLPLNFTSENSSCANEEACWEKEQAKIEQCKEGNKSSYNWLRFVILFEEILPFLVLIISIIFVILMIIKLVYLFKFQWKSNKENLKTNIQIVSVFSIQTILLSFLAAMEFMGQLHDQDGHTILIPSEIKYRIINSLPFWFQCLLNSDSLKYFREMRTLLESLIVLLVMKDYRNDLLLPFIWISKVIKMICFKNICNKVNRVKDVECMKPQNVSKNTLFSS